MMRLILISFIVLLSYSSVISQVNILWQARYTSAGSNADRAESMVVDDSGNVYVTGTGWGTSGTFDYITIKYNASGNQVWKAEYNGTGNGLDKAHAIAIDANFVYVTGLSYGTGSNGFDYATLKYNRATGAAIWVSASRYTGTYANGTDEAFAIGVDNAGNVYITGTSDSSPITAKLNSAAATVKYNSAGVQQWVMRYEGSGGGLDAAYALYVDKISGDVFVAGNLDVGVGTLINVNYLTIKYNTSGVQQWAFGYDGPAAKYDEARSIKADASGNVYVTGLSQNTVVTNYDIATIKYNPAGVQQWVDRYNGTGNSYDRGNDLVLDAQGNVYVTGRSVGLSPAAEDIITIKYNNAGVQKWVSRYDNGGVNPYDEGKAIVADKFGSVYVTGYSSISGQNDYTTLKYDSLGVLQWKTNYNGSGNNSDQAAAIAIDTFGNVYVSGLSRGAGSNEDFLTIKYCQLKSDAGKDTAICIGASVQLNASALDAVSYSWTPNNGSLTSATIANPVATPTVTTAYVVSISNSNGCVDTDTIVITVSQYPTTTITPSGPTTFCIGDSVTLTADSTDFYQWSSSVNDTLQSVTVNTSGTYTVTLTNLIGCVSTATATVIVNTANVVVSANDTTCSNASINIPASGGVTYNWHPGNSLNDSTIANPVATPTLTTTYTVSIVDANGCTDIDSTTIVVLPAPVKPTISVGGTYTLVCSGTYSSYQWYLNNILINGATNPVYIYNQNGSYTVVVTDSTGCSETSNPYNVTNYIGIDEISDIALLNVYPNPVSDNLIINIEFLKESDIRIVLSSLSGQIIHSENFANYKGNYRKEVNTNNIASGIYYLQVMAGENVVTKKIVKQ